MPYLVLMSCRSFCVAFFLFLLPITFRSHVTPTLFSNNSWYMKQVAENGFCVWKKNILRKSFWYTKQAYFPFSLLLYTCTYVLIIFFILEVTVTECIHQVAKRQNIIMLTWKKSNFKFKFMFCVCSQIKMMLKKWRDN